MDGECGGLPARVGGMAGLAIGPDANSSMRWIGRLVVVADMTAGACIWCGGVITVMA